jgi:hypothetical protein
MDIGFLYLAEELDSSNPTVYTKVGITSQRCPAERLRKLQIGNPRPMQFTFMWVGDTKTISYIEKTIIHMHNLIRTREWIPLKASELKKIIDFRIEANDHWEVFEVPAHYLPYTAISYGKCPFDRNFKGPTQIFNEARNN